MITREKLKENLKTQIGNIEFTKKDGTIRNLKCSLSPQLLPISEFDTENYTPSKNQEVLNVWDLEKQDWRSFRLDSIRNCSFETI